MEVHREGREAQKDSDPTFTTPPSLWVLESKRGRGEVVRGAKNRAEEEEGALHPSRHIGERNTLDSSAAMPPGELCLDRKAMH